MFSLNAVRFIAVAAFAVFVFSGEAPAETVSSSQWGFSATFPCQSEVSTRPVATAQGNITMTTYACHEGGRRYLIAFADFPAGAITKETAENGYEAAVNSVASAASGTIRSAVPYSLGDITGRNVVVDMASKRGTIHARIFYFGDRQFQVMFLGPTGEENGKDCLDFLNSFAAVK